MAFIPLKNFFSIWHFKLIGLIGPRAVSERVKERIERLLAHGNPSQPHTGTYAAHAWTLMS